LAQLAALGPDEGAKGVLRRCSRLGKVELIQGGFDVDTPADVARLQMRDC
jgi:hypothetical protein